MKPLSTAPSSASPQAKPNASALREPSRRLASIALAAIFVCASLGAGLAAWQLAKQSRERALSEAQSVAANAAEAVCSRVALLDGSLAALELSIQPSSASSPAALAQRLSESLSSSLPGPVALAAINSDGSLLACSSPLCTPTPAHGHVFPAEAAKLLSASNHTLDAPLPQSAPPSSTLVPKSITLPSFGSPQVLLLARPAQRTDGSPAAVLGAFFDARLLSAALSESLLSATPKNAHAELFDEEGRLVGSTLVAPSSMPWTSAFFDAHAESHPFGLRLSVTVPALGFVLALWPQILAIVFFWSAFCALGTYCCRLLWNQSLAAALAAKASAERANMLEEFVLGREADLHEALNQLEIANAEVANAEKLSSLGAMVAGIAHELGTPIGNLAVGLSSLEEQLAQAAVSFANGDLTRGGLARHLVATRAAAELAHASCERCARLVSSFKQVSMDQASETARMFDLSQVCRDIADSFRPSLKGTGIELIVEPSDMIACMGSPGAASQILTNLLQNALFHAFPHRRKGTIRIRAEAVSPTSVVVEVADDGEGMDADTLSRVFDPYFTTRASSGGSGIGLSIARQQALAMGGTLSVDSAPGAGSCFCLSFPRGAYAS